MNVLNELRFRIDCLEDVRRKIEVGELQPTAAENILKWYLKTPVMSAVSYCDIDSESSYSDTGNHESEVKMTKAQYLSRIAALEATITKRREAEKNRPVLEAIKELTRKENEHYEATRQLIERQASRGYKEQEPSKEKGKPGRSVKDIRERINAVKYTDIEAMYSKLESLIKGRKGKTLALIALVATDRGIFIERPTFGELQKAFGAAGSDKGYCSYMRKGLRYYTEDERNGVLRSLLED